MYDPFERSFDRLEDALKAIMESKRATPDDITYLSPADPDISSEWDDANRWISTTPDYTNLPIIGTSDDDIDYDSEIEAYLRLVANEDKYIETVSQKICQKFKIKDSNSGWEISSISAFDSDCNIYLFIVPEKWDEVRLMVEEFNAQVFSLGFNPLILDDNIKMIKGSVEKKLETGGFFQKQKIKRQNKEYVTHIKQFLDSLNDYLRRV